MSWLNVALGFEQRGDKRCLLWGCWRPLSDVWRGWVKHRQTWPTCLGCWRLLRPGRRRRGWSRCSSRRGPWPPGPPSCSACSESSPRRAGWTRPRAGPPRPPPPARSPPPPPPRDSRPSPPRPWRTRAPPRCLAWCWRIRSAPCSQSWSCNTNTV